MPETLESLARWVREYRGRDLYGYIDEYNRRQKEAGVSDAQIAKEIARIYGQECLLCHESYIPTAVEDFGNCPHCRKIFDNPEFQPNF